MKTLEQIRAQSARHMIDWLEGRTDRHPQGQSGLRHIIPNIMSSKCDDGPWWASEWGRLSGAHDGYDPFTGRRDNAAEYMVVATGERFRA